MKDIYSLLSELANLDEKDLQVFIPLDALIFRNRLNLIFLRNSLEKLGKSITFETDDPNGAEIISRLNSEGDGDFGEIYSSEEDYTEGIFSKIGSLLAAFSLGKIKRPKLPKLAKLSFQINFVLLGILAAAIAGLVFGATRYISSQKAYIKLMTKVEPLARSITITVDSERSTAPEEKILGGKDISATLIEEVETETTGEKIEGEYAEGEIQVYNRTEEEIELEEGQEVVYKGEDADLVYTLNSDVTVPPLNYEVPEDPASTMIPGGASVEVTASEFGEDYNIDSGGSFEFEDYKKSELVAKSNVNFEGGFEEIISVVAQEDLDKLEVEVRDVINSKVSSALENAVPEEYKMIQGSRDLAFGDPEFSDELADETEKVSLRQIATVSALGYSEKELDQLIMQIVGEYVPEEYSIFGTKHTLNVEVLGETENTVLSPTTADLQVTVKTSVIPDMDIENLKKELAGATLDEVQRKLGSMDTLSTYELNLSPGIPFRSRIPSDPEKIFIEVEEE